MRSFAVMLFLVTACSNSEDAAREAEAEAQALQAKTAAAAQQTVRQRPPVMNEAAIPCAQLIDLPGFQTALGEKEPLSVRDNPKADMEAAAVCSVVRGGKQVTVAEQKARLKKAPRLGVLPGDELCRVTAYCWTVEDPDKFQKRCKEKGFTPTDIGTPACLQIVAQGADDVHSYSFYDTDTKCILKVSGGPSNVDNDLIGNCARTARDLVTPTHIAVGGGGSAAPEPTPASASAADAPK